MRRTILAVLGFPALAWGAQELPDGRWEGVVRIPERELVIVVDLARSEAGAWAGSIILPGLDIKGGSLSNIVVTGPEVAFDLGGALASTPHGAATLKLRVATADTMAGEMQQAGNVAPVSLRRTGSARVDPPPRSTPVLTAIEDRWSGEYELGGYPRRVTLVVQNRAEGGATADWVIVGKQTTRLPVDLVTQDGDYLRVESQASRAAFEGRLVESRGEIHGTIELGAIELPLVLQRVGKRP
jgi:hypothetical protein